MRTVLILILLSMAGSCFAGDPLETLNTVEDTLKTMKRTVKVLTASRGGSNGAGNTAGVGDAGEDVASERKPGGEVGRVKARPSSEESIISEVAPDSGS